MNRKNLWRIVKREIDNRDFMGILFGDLNPDEYDIEVDAITERIEAGSSVNEIAKVIFDVFSGFFWPDCVSMIECTKAAFHITENIIRDEKRNHENH